MNVLPEFHGVAVVVAAILFSLTLAGCGPEAPRPPAAPATAGQPAKPPASNPKDEMRMPWTPASAGFLRSWLVVGEFPNPPHPGATTYDHTPPCVGLDTDYLKERGGDAAIRPTAGMTVRRPDGSTASWTVLKSSDNLIDLEKAFAGRPTINVVAYAFTTYDSPKAGPAVLAVGSDDGVRIWLNGQVVHNLLAGRSVMPDQDIVPVTLKKGPNTLLVKVENGGGGWGFCLRVLAPGQVSVLRGGSINPTIIASDDPEMLTVQTDSLAPVPGTEVPGVRVELVAPGGRVAAMREVPRGETLRLPVKGFADGPYEIRCTAALPSGRRDVRHLPWYKGDAAAAAKRVVETAAAADTSTPEGMVHQMLAEMLLDRVGGDLEKLSTAAWPSLHSPLMEFAELGQAAVRPYGFVRMAYRDPVDDSPQFCRVYLPPGYDPEKKWPLVVSLHGYNPPNPPYVRWWGVDERHNGLADRYDVIEIEPHARGNTAYQGIGETDVLRCIAMVEEQFSLDPGRIYLMGYSMGGGGTWHLGTRHTDLFAAIAPIFGGWDYHVRMDEKELAALTPRGRLMAERTSSFRSAENLLNTPVFVNHGDADALVDVNHSRWAVRMLQRWGYDIGYWEHPGGGHGGLGCEDTLMEWFLAHQRQAAPTHVRVRAADLLGAQAHWLQVTARQDPLALIVADAEITGPNTVRLDTENALEVTLAPRGPTIDPARPIKVVWNGADARTAALDDGRLTLRAGGYTAEGLRKRPGLEGPISAATTTPFAIVVGTIATDPMMKRLCERLAEDTISGWQKWQHARPRVFKDTEISQDDLARYSLILIGGPEANAVTSVLAGQLPLKISGDEVTIDGRAFRARDAAVRLIYPNPLNPERMVLVTAATSAKGMYAVGDLPDDVDFVIGDGRIADPAAGRTEEKLFIASGYFDPSWRRSDKFVDLGDPVARLKSTVRKAPVHLSAAAAREAYLLPLADVLESSAEGSFTVMRRDANWQGQPIRLGGKTYLSGIGVAVRHETCAADWDIGAGEWKRLRATIGIEIEKPEKLEAKHKENTRVVFIVKGDGKELFRSKPVRWDSPPLPINVDIAGVKVLRLEVENETLWFWAASSVNWADVRLER